MKILATHFFCLLFNNGNGTHNWLKNKHLDACLYIKSSVPLQRNSIFELSGQGKRTPIAIRLNGK